MRRANDGTAGMPFGIVKRYNVNGWAMESIKVTCAEPGCNYSFQAERTVFEPLIMRKTEYVTRGEGEMAESAEELKKKIKTLPRMYHRWLDFVAKEYGYYENFRCPDHAH